MIAKSISGTSVSAIAEALEQQMEDGFLPTLAFVFCSKSLDLTEMRQLFDEKDIQIFGATTNGEFTNEEPQNGTAAILLLDLNQEYFNIYFEAFPANDFRDIASTVARKAQSDFNKPAFLLGLSDPTTDGEQVLRGMEDVFGNEVTIFGGCAGDDYSFTNTFVFTNTELSSKAMVCLAIEEEKVAVHGIATCGWKAVGTEKTVTKSEGNHVYTIDNIPALDITTKYGGLENITPNNKDLLVELAGNFPLQLQREKGDPIMRPGLVVDWEDRSFYTSGTVPQGSKVRFSLPPDFDVMEKVIKGVEQLKEDKMPEAEALIVFSCAGRILSFGPMMNEELEGVKNVWNVPMVGMFSNGELGRATGGNLEMHNLTTCCVVLKEK